MISIEDKHFHSTHWTLGEYQGFSFVISQSITPDTVTIEVRWEGSEPPGDLDSIENEIIKKYKSKDFYCNQ